MPGFLQKQRWTRLEVVIWLFGFAFMVIRHRLKMKELPGSGQK